MAKLQEFLGRKDLDKHLDADEAIVLGASLNAANLSDGIKLNRKLGMVDGSSYGFLLELNGPELLEDNTDTLFIPRLKKMPIKLFRSFKHDKDFEASLSYDKAGELPPGVSSYIFAEYSILGLSEASEKYSTHNISSPIKANLHFSLSRGGILSLDRADAAIEISEWVEVLKKNTTKDNSSSSFNAASETSTGTISQDSAETLKAAEDNNISSNSTESEKEAITVTEKILKKKTFRIPLKAVEKNIGPGSNLPKDSFLEAKMRLETLDKKDTERRRTAELKNSLEEYIYSTREKIHDNAEVEKVSTEEECRSFSDKLSEVQEWLYTDGEDAPANEFKEHLELLKAIGDPIFFRLNELNARPIACEHARVHLNELQKIVNNWETNKPWIPKDRIEEVWSEAEKLKNWLEEKEELQKKTSVFDAPIFTSEEVNQKVSKLQDKIASVNRIPKPRPKIEKPTEEETVSQDNNTRSSGATSDEPPSETEQSNDSVDASNSETDQESTRDEL